MRPRRKVWTQVIVGLAVVLAVAMGIALGLAVAATRNTEKLKSFGEYQPALPTEILDRDGRLITQFFSDEKRDLVTLDEIPQHLIHAVLAREDQHFYDHKGFRPLMLVKAVIEYLGGADIRGASTITQQLAGWTYEDRSEKSVRRKLAELWWAVQMERRLTKDEILEQYLNEMPLGHNTSGVEAATQFYFTKSVRQITLAESAMLVIIYANWTLYSPFRNPNLARQRTSQILDQMVELGYATRDEADISFAEYWDNFDYTRSAADTAFFSNYSQAPYFSEYIRVLLDELLFGAVDIYRDGLKVYTTLDLDTQHIADEVMAKHIDINDKQYKSIASRARSVGREQFLPIVSMLSFAFNMADFQVGTDRIREDSKRAYVAELNPSLDALASIFGISTLKSTTRRAHAVSRDRAKQTELQGALVSLDSRSGHILAMVGGRQWESGDQFNRAVGGLMQPGSSFKPLYYSYAIESRKFTMSTMIVDAPVRFINPDNTFYEPLNFRGYWEGPVLLWWALANSMNVPSVKVLDAIGIEPTVDWASRLLGISGARELERAFKPPWGYPVGLGVCGVNPLQMARAYATFPNGGEAVEPVAIVKIVDRNGDIIMEPEKEMRLRRAGGDTALMTPQTAFIMTELLQNTVKVGTLRSARRRAGLEGDWDRPIAGKTGTTDNWVAAWTVGFTPQITTALWFGFDQGNQTLGTSITGATAGGPAWGEYMDAVHAELPVKEFTRPKSGLVERKVCTVSGKLPTELCPHTMTLTFIAGTDPRDRCEVHPYYEEQHRIVVERESRSLLKSDLRSALPSRFLRSFLDDAPDTQTTSETPSGNPLLD